MLADARRVPAGAALESDVCIIGAGAAGIAIARELEGAGKRVVVLESGGREPDPATQGLAAGEVAGGLPYFPLFVARLRYLGGSTNHWGGVCKPLSETDFERREWIPHSGWPIPRSALDGYYGRARAIVRLPYPDYRTAVWAQGDREQPFPLRPSRIETRIAQVVEKRRRSFADAYGDELERARDVTVYLHANAVEIQAEGRAATRVRVATLAGGRFTVSARVFVLAAGGLENPRLLLASNRDRPRGLGNEHDLVGRFFLEHPRFDAAIVVPADRRRSAGFYEPHRARFGRLQGYLALPDAVKRAEELVDVQVKLRTTYEPEYEEALSSARVDALRRLVRRRGGDLAPDVRALATDLMSWQQYVVPGAPLPLPHPDLVAAVADGVGAQRLLPDVLGDAAAFAYKELTGRVPTSHLVLTTRIDPVPNPDSRVVLQHERDALGMPRLRLQWRLSDLDRHSVARTLELLVASPVAASRLLRAQLGGVERHGDRLKVPLQARTPEEVLAQCSALRITVNASRVVHAGAC